MPLLATLLSVTTACSFFVSAKPKYNLTSQKNCGRPRVGFWSDVAIATSFAVAAGFMHTKSCRSDDQEACVGFDLESALMGYSIAAALPYAVGALVGSGKVDTCRELVKHPPMDAKQRRDSETRRKRAISRAGVLEGDLVRHSTFGVGQVEATSDAGPVRVLFLDHGLKVVPGTELEFVDLEAGLTK